MMSVGNPATPDTGPVRRRRFVRHRNSTLPFVLQDRDLEIVRLVAAYRVISSPDIQLLVPGSEQGILRRLQRLFHAGYLDRPRQQRILGNLPMVYALGQRGADLVAQENGRKPKIDWSEKNRQLQIRYLEHALMISRFHAALEYASAMVGAVNVERWCPDGTIRDAVVVETDGRRERIPVAPDAFFIVRILEGREVNRVHCFLEADRGSMTLARFAAKLRGYFQYWRTGRAEKRLGMKNFLVLAVTTSPERAANLREICSSVSSRGLRMFLFCCERDYLPAKNRALLEPIWRTPADDQGHALLE